MDTVLYVFVSRRKQKPLTSDRRSGLAPPWRLVFLFFFSCAEFDILIVLPGTSRKLHKIFHSDPEGASSDLPGAPPHVLHDEENFV